MFLNFLFEEIMNSMESNFSSSGMSINVSLVGSLPGVDKYTRLFYTDLLIGDVKYKILDILGFTYIEMVDTIR